MVLDHLGKIVLWWWMEPLHAAGRLALPLFALIAGLRLAQSPPLWSKYLRRMLPWGLLAQPAFIVVADVEWWTLNILFTLAAGAAIDALIQQRALLPGLIAVAVSPFCEFGVPGVLMVPTLAAIARRRPLAAAGACGPLALVANLNLDPDIMVLNLAALFAAPVAWRLLARPLAVPRPPGWFYYGFYAGHLYLLWAWYHWVI